MCRPPLYNVGIKTLSFGYRSNVDSTRVLPFYY